MDSLTLDSEINSGYIDYFEDVPAPRKKMAPNKQTQFIRSSNSYPILSKPYQLTTYDHYDMKMIYYVQIFLLVILIILTVVDLLLNVVSQRSIPLYYAY